MQPQISLLGRCNTSIQQRYNTDSNLRNVDRSGVISFAGKQFEANPIAVVVHKNYVDEPLTLSSLKAGSDQPERRRSSLARRLSGSAIIRMSRPTAT